MTRMHFFIFTALLIWMPFFVSAAATGDVIFSEIAYDLKGADDGHEWVEIYNKTSGDIDITGWKFSDGANHILNAPPKNGGQGAMVIPAGGYAVLAGDAALFLADHPGFSGTVIDTVMSLHNTGATLSLFDKDGIAIDTVTYQKEWGAAGTGMTLERDSAGNWKESAQEGGTAGAENGGASAAQDTQQNNEASATTTPSIIAPQSLSALSAEGIVADAGDNVVALTGEEIMFDASGTHGGGGATFIWNFGDGTVASGETIFHRYLFPGKYIVVLSVSGSEDTIEANIYPHGITLSEFMPESGTGEREWIEIHNDSAYSADLSRWGVGTSDKKPSFIIPKGTTLAAGGYMVLAQDVSRVTLPNEKGAITLWYPHGQSAERVEYDHAKKGSAAARKSDGSYVWTDQRTPGARNVFIISEAHAGNEPKVASVDDTVTHASMQKGIWQRVRDDAGGSVKSFIAEPAHAMVYDEGASAVSLSQIAAPALAYGAFPLGVVAVIMGMAGGVLGTLLIRKKIR